MSDAAVSLLVLAVSLALFIWNRLPVGLVAIITAVLLYLTGQVTAGEAVAGFGDPVVVFIATLFVVSEGLDSSGVTAWAGQQLVRRSGRSHSRLLVAAMAVTALLAAVVTPNGAAAAVLPVVVLAARRAGLLPAHLLMPVAFAASAGALLLLSGSPVNVIVSGELRELTGEPFGYAEFAVVGLPLVLVTIVVAVLGRRLVPARQPAEAVPDLSDHPATILGHYRLTEGTYRLRVPVAGDAIGFTPRGLLRLVEGASGVRLLGVQGGDAFPTKERRTLYAEDVLVVAGSPDGVAAVVRECGLEVVSRPSTRDLATLHGRDHGLAEVVVPPRSRLEGELMFPGIVLGGVEVLAVSRLGEELGLARTELAVGDMLLVRGRWADVEALAENPDLLVVDDPEAVRRQSVPLGATAWRALGALAVTVALLASGFATPAIAGLVGAGLMVALRVVTPQHAYRAVSWQTVVLIGGLIPLSTAIASSGAADLVAKGLLSLVSGADVRVLLAAIFVLTLVLGQVVSNAATVLIVVPIAVAVASDAGIALAPVLMLVAVAGATSFLTPIATPANLIVMGPAGYRFADYWRLGLALSVAWFVVAIVLIPIVWVP